ncbi:MAG: hypothetical protein LBB16_00990 [Puniceicoccales bacterium]|jgi:hypothetical protein|nr:hypothetical protein [Puniceicoccales bacterium]
MNKITSIQTIFDTAFEQVRGFPTEWLNAGKIASLAEVDEIVISEMKLKAELTKDILSRIDLARREVCKLGSNKRTNVEAFQKYRNSRNRLKQLEVVWKLMTSGFPIPNMALAELIQQADPGTESVNYEEKWVENIDQRVKINMGDRYQAITAQSSDPEVVALEQAINRRFGIKVRFGDKLNLARQTYAVCEQVRLLGHKFPKEIILCESTDKHCSGLAYKEPKGDKYIIIANIDPEDIDVLVGELQLQMSVDCSFRGTLFHELGHINTTSHLRSFLDEFSKQLHSCVDAAIEEYIATSPESVEEDMAQKLANVIAEKKQAIEQDNQRSLSDKAHEMIVCLSELQATKGIDLRQIIAPSLKAFMDSAEDCPWKRIAQKVSLYAASSPSEFVAEVYCGCMLGKSYDEEIMSMYVQLGGAPLQ